MNRQKKIASVLAGVSFAALAVAASPSFAAGKFIGPADPVPITVTGAWDYIEINAYNGSGDPGDVTNEATVGIPGTREGILVWGGSTINGSLVNNAAVNASIIDNNAFFATATGVAGIFVTENSLIVNGIINNDDIEAYAAAGEAIGGEGRGPWYRIQQNVSQRPRQRVGDEQRRRSDQRHRQCLCHPGS